MSLKHSDKRTKENLSSLVCKRILHSSFFTHNLKNMIRIVIYQNLNPKVEEAYKKWYPRVVADETIGLDELAEHMASHNTPFSKGAIKGILTDAVVCTKELLLLGKNVKFPDLAIFSIGLKVKEGAPTKEDFTVAKYISGLKLRARATGELSSANLDTTIRRVDTVKADSTKTDTPSKDDSGTVTPPSDNKGDSGTTTTPTTPSGGGSSSSDGEHLELP